MNPVKFSIIPFQQPSSLQCPACAYTAPSGAATANFKTGAAIIDGVPTDCLQLVCTRCQYGNSLEWLMAVAT